MREKKDINIYIGNEIRIARERAGLTQEQFGEMVSLGTKNISAIERGVTGITISTLKKSARNCQFPATPFCLGSKRKTMLRIWRNGWSGYRQNSLQQ